MSACPFCLIVHGRAAAEIVHRWDDALAIAPLNPVIDGHVLIVPNQHVADALIVPEVTARAMRRAAQLADGPCNIITSVGVAATQTVRHLHLHIVPRRDGDGLLLPWSLQGDIGDLVELLAARVHEGWVALKAASGVTSRLSETGEELVAPYEQLSEQAKDLDRGTVHAVLDAITGGAA